MSAKTKTLRLVGKSLLNYTYKNPDKNALRLLKVAKKVTGNQFPATTFTRPVEILSDENNNWHKFYHRLLNTVDHDVITKTLLAFAIDAGLEGTATVRANREKYNCNIPFIVLMDPTSACNLKCKGCWAAEYGYKSNLTLDEMRRVIKECKELGTHFFMFTGGEPLIRKKDLITIAKENPDCIFLAFTNGTLVDDEFCNDLIECGNFTVALSIEGTEETNDVRRGEGVYKKTVHAMELLKKHGCLFGTSVCYTSQNYEAVTSDEFYDKMIDLGVMYMWYFHYMPVGGDADTGLLLTPDQREHVYRQLRSKRGSEVDGKGVSNPKPIFTIDFQNDAEYVGGCIAGGRNYFHINSEGDVEPCVFVHYSDTNIREKSIFEALNAPLFKEYYHGQPFNDNMLRPCPMLENPTALRKMVERSGAKSTNLLHAETAEELCAKCDEYSKAWTPRAKEIWEEKERFKPFTQYYRNTPEGKENYNPSDF